MDAIKKDVLLTGVLEQEMYNPTCRLISVFVNIKGKYIDLVYGKDINGFETLEAYYYHTKWQGDGHFRSNAWMPNKIPKKYIPYFEMLQKRVRFVQQGHKIKIQLA